jgi:hypothetical protein
MIQIFLDTVKISRGSPALGRLTTMGDQPFSDKRSENP